MSNHHIFSGCAFFCYIPVMAFTRIRTIKGRDYRYLEERWREGGKMCSRSICLGPVGGTVRRRKGVLRRVGEFITTNFQHGHVFDMETLAREAQEVEQRKEAMIAAGLAELHERYGFPLGPSSPVPIEKPMRNDAFLNAKRATDQHNAQPANDQHDAPTDVSGGTNAK
jgi:hypothetical protein